MTVEKEIQAMVDHETEAWNRQDAEALVRWLLIFHAGLLDYSGLAG
jgi:hypothetical protein